MGARILALTALAMVAFAANSVIGRLGLIEGGIGAGSFAAIRLVSGGIVLALLAGPANTVRAGSWTGGIALLSYAAFFSYAYLSLPAGTGALLLFAVVQVTMVGAGILSGERLSAVQWTGLIAAFAGLVWLVSPGLQAPPLLGALAMGVAGIGWGVYSLLGRSGGDPTANTAGNFVRASLLALVLLPPALLLAPEPAPHLTGIALAVLSGAVTSGLGYAVWYTALKGLSATQAGAAQLTVPALAALGGILVLSEPLTFRFAMSSLIILAGVGLATLTPSPKVSPKTD